jgi:hypothetical protein
MATFNDVISSLCKLGIQCCETRIQRPEAKHAREKENQMQRAWERSVTPLRRRTETSMAGVK